MKHLFMINPIAQKVRGRVAAETEKIHAYFREHPELSYDIHVTRWCRDAMGYVRRYVSACEDTVRVHAVGGTGTLYETVNGVMGLKNAQVAAYPLGSSNEFLQYFRRANMKYFENIHTQVHSGTLAVDTFSDGANHALTNFLVGVEADAYISGAAFAQKTHVVSDLWPQIFAGIIILSPKRTYRHYRIVLDGERDISGSYASLMLANTPCYQKNLNPAVDAHPTDGKLEVYLVKPATRFRLLQVLPLYTSGKYHLAPDVFVHESCRKIEISCNDIMPTSVDGEVLFGRKMFFKVAPKSISFVVPDEIDPSTIPPIYAG